LWITVIGSRPSRSGQLAQRGCPERSREETGLVLPQPAHGSVRRSQTVQILLRSPALQATHRHTHEFAEILTQRRGERLPAWMGQIDTDGEPALRSFVAGLRTDLDAVTAGLTLEHNSGPVEGAVNRIKMIKRQMFGRANFDLLRKRVLLAT
jgi:transposase